MRILSQHHSTHLPHESHELSRNNFRRSPQIDALPGDPARQSSPSKILHPASKIAEIEGTRAMEEMKAIEDFNEKD